MTKEERWEAAYQFTLAAMKRGENLNDPETNKRLREEFAKVTAKND